MKKAIYFVSDILALVFIFAVMHWWFTTEGHHVEKIVIGLLALIYSRLGNILNRR